MNLQPLVYGVFVLGLILLLELTYSKHQKKRRKVKVL
jgi:hypothetical protein